MSSVMLRTGPLYFHDQLKTKTIKRAKKLPEELPSDMKYLNINPRLANFINSLNKNNKKGAAAHVEIKQETLPKEDTVRKEKYPVLPEIFGSNLSKSNVDNPNPKTSHTLADEEQFMNPFEEYKYAAPSLLYELGKLLHFFSQYEIILPQGVVNVLNYSWMELIKGTVYTKRNWQSLAYKRVRTSTSLAPEECDSKLTGPGTAPENVESIKNNKNTASATVAESGKEKWVQETAQNKPTGHKSTQGFASNLPVTISFSMSSRACEDKGWISEQQGSKSEDLEWKVLYAWAVERLQLAQIQINKQVSVLKEKGFCKPVILRHYDSTKKEALMNPRKTCKIHSFVLLNGKPHIPEIQRENASLRKLHYSLIDGSSMIYYPSGHLAVCQSHSGLQCGGVYTNIFSPEQVMLGTFSPFGHGSICFPDSNIFALLFNQEGGVMTDKEGDTIKEWNWPQKGKLTDPITLQVNEYLSVRIGGQFAVSLMYKWQHESVRLSLSPLLDVVPPHLEDLGLLVTSESFSSRTARELSKAIRKKAKEKDTKKSPKKTSILVALAKTLEIPEEHISPSNDFNAATELRKLQRKIRNILDDWMEHYRLASGVDSPHIQKMSEAPPRTSRKRKVQSAAVLQVTAPAPKSQHVKETDEGEPPGAEGPLLLGRFQSAPAHNMRWDTPQSSYSPRPSSFRSVNVKQDKSPAESSISKNVPGSHILSKSGILAVPSVPLLSLGQDHEKLWHMSHHTCPAVLQRMMLGEEGRLCRCSNHQIPYVTDLEYDQLISNQMSSVEQITVVCVVSSSLDSEEDQRKDVLEQLYGKRNRYRSMPCMQSRLDSFRLLKYDINSSSELPGHMGSPLLVQRHNAAPGMFLMYIRGKLLFANYIFNGYSRSVKDLQKQIAKTRSDYKMGYCLPKNFKFSHEDNLNSSTVNTAQPRKDDALFGHNIPRVLHWGI